MSYRQHDDLCLQDMPYADDLCPECLGYLRDEAAADRAERDDDRE